MNEAVSKYLVQRSPILHDNERYEIGDEIELTAKAAGRLLKEKFLKPAEDDAQDKNSGGGKGGKKK